MKTPPIQTAIEGAPDKANSNSKNILERHYCYCRLSCRCIFCLPRNNLRPRFDFGSVVRVAAA